ncbi:MAG: MFS transporter [Oscillospiraceae bacterium]|nr:MFS transporter [Oscillospiraceae bacterium]
MKKVRNLRFKAIIGAFFLIPGILLMFLFGFFGNIISLGDNYIPKISYVIDNYYTATVGEDGYRYISANEKQAVIKMNADGVIQNKIDGFSYHGGDSYSEANQICTDTKGNVYIADLEWSDAGFTVAKERILMYNKYGIFEKEILCMDYSESPAQKTRIMGLHSVGDEISFLYMNTESVDVYKSVSGSKAELDATIPYSDVSTIQESILGEDGKTVYFTDKFCNVCSLSADGVKTVIMDAKTTPDYTVPYRLSSQKNGEIFVTDIGNACVYRISADNQTECIVTLENTDLNRITNIHLADGKILLIFTDRVSEVDLTTGELTDWSTCETAGSLSAIWYAVYIVQALCLLTGLVSAVYLIIQVVKRLYSMGYVNKWKFPIIGTCGILMAAAIVIPTVLTSFRELYFSSYQNETHLISKIAADTIDAENLEKIRTPEDYGSPAYRQLREEAENVINREYTYGENIYLNIIKLNDNRAYAMFYLDDSIGGYYPLSEYEHDMLAEVYRTGETGHTDDAADATGSYTYVLSPVFNKSGQVAGVVEVGMDLNAMHQDINDIMTDIIITLAMLIVICVFLMNEAVSFVQNRSEYRAAERSNAIKERVPMHELRIMTMLCFTALNMPTSFMPVYLESMHYEGLFFSQTQCGTIPLTVNFALMAVMALFCAPIARKFSFRNTAAAGALISMLGDIALSMNNFYAALTGLILNGLGLGLILNILTICVSGFKTEAEKNKGFAITTGASLSGMLCGTVIGANLAKYIGEEKMFWCSAALWIVELIICMRVGKHFNEYVAMPPQQTDDKNGMHWYQFIRKPSILGFVILVEFPAAVMACFCSYFVPIFADSIGMNEVRTSLIVVVNSLSGALASVLFTDALLRKMGRNAMYFICAIVAGAILLFAWTKSLVTLIIAMIVFGVAESVGVPARSTCYCMDKNSVRYGEDKAMGVYNFSDNAGNSAGTSLFGALLTLGTTTGLSIIAAGATGLMAVYRVLFHRSSKEDK